MIEMYYEAEKAGMERQWSIVNFILPS